MALDRRIIDMYSIHEEEGAGCYWSWDDDGGVEAVEAAPDLAEVVRRHPAAGDGEEDPLQLGDEAHHPARRRQQQREGQHPDAQLQDQHHPLAAAASSSSNPLVAPSLLLIDRVASPPRAR